MQPHSWAVLCAAIRVLFSPLKLFVFHTRSLGLGYICVCYHAASPNTWCRICVLGTSLTWSAGLCKAYHAAWRMMYWYYVARKQQQ